MKAVWKDTVIAQSKDTVVVEGNHYFPRASLQDKYIKSSDYTTHCFWKGDASYYDLVVDGETNKDAVWYYAKPLDGAEAVKDRVAFWRGVKVSE